MYFHQMLQNFQLFFLMQSKIIISGVNKHVSPKPLLRIYLARV